MKIDNSPARGMRDLLPADVAVRDHVLESISAVYRRFGYQRIDTPALEHIDRLSSGEGGDNEKLIFEVLRRGLPPEVPPGTPLRELVDLGLRYDLTVPLTRFYGNNHASLPMPFRSLQVGPVWRADRPQRGRYRQFYQCDIDMIGEPSVLAEAELIEATTEALAAIGLTGTTVRVSDRRFLAALAADCGVPAEEQDTFFITVDKLDKIGWNGVQAELAELGFDPAQVAAAEERIRGLIGVPADKLADALARSVPTLAPEVVADLSATAASLERLARDRPLDWQFDPTLVRGMGYYTGHVFEIIHPDMSGSVAGGGRYDKLIGRSLGHDVRPAGSPSGSSGSSTCCRGSSPGTRSRCWWRATSRCRTRSRWRGRCVSWPGPGAWSRRCGGAGSSARSANGSRRPGSPDSCWSGPRTEPSYGTSCGRWAASRGRRAGAPGLE